MANLGIMTANEFVLSSWTKSWRRWRRAKGERAGGTPAYRQAGRRYEGNVRNDSKCNVRNDSEGNGCPVPQAGNGRYRIKKTVKDARLKKSRRPLQSQRHSQEQSQSRKQSQRRPPKKSRRPLRMQLQRPRQLRSHCGLAAAI